MTKPNSFVLLVMQKYFCSSTVGKKTNCTIVSWIIMLKIYWVKAFLEVFHADRRPEANQLAARYIQSLVGLNDSLSGVPDYFYRNKISSGGDLSHYSSASLY